MALTDEGKALTVAYRAAQSQVAAETVGLARQAWKLLDPTDLARSQAGWLATTAQIINIQNQRSQDISREYYDRMRQAEIGEGMRVLDSKPVDDGLVADSLMLKGPISIKQGISRGQSEGQAVRNSLSRVQGACMKLALDGGRGFLIDTAYHDGRAEGWRRVTDGKPCAFCAMLAGRGPVYKKHTASFSSPDYVFKGSGLAKAHDYCECTIEVVYGAWIPNELEEEWREAYLAAAESADLSGQARVAPSRRAHMQEEDNILWRMRRARPDLFHDGVKTKF